MPQSEAPRHSDSYIDRGSDISQRMYQFPKVQAAEAIGTVVAAEWRTDLVHWFACYAKKIISVSGSGLSSGLKKIIAAFNDIECRLSKANTCRAISAIACSTLLNQSRLKLYHYTSRPRLRLGRGSDFYTRVEANDCTKHHRKQRRAQCVESSDHCRLASACVTFVQDVA